MGTDFPRIKVTPKVAKLFANLQMRNKTRDGNYILWMSDLDTVPGDTIADRAAYVGGALLTPMETKMECQGTAAQYKSVSTPVYLDKDAETEAASNKQATDNNGSESTDTGYVAPEVVGGSIPSVVAPAGDSHAPEENTEGTEGADSATGSENGDHADSAAADAAAKKSK
jgi:hypothetical protein